MINKNWAPILCLMVIFTLFCKVILYVAYFLLDFLIFLVDFLGAFKNILHMNLHQIYVLQMFLPHCGLLFNPLNNIMPSEKLPVF